MNMRLGVFIRMRLETQLSQPETMKYCILLRTHRKVLKSHGNNLFVILLCVYRPVSVECFYELSLIYFDIFCVN